MKISLVPRTTEFYDLFTRAGANALETAQRTEERFRQDPDARLPHSEIKELENEGDSLTQEIIQLLNTQYITPFDREDIYSLATAVDDVVDYIDEASDLLGLYKIETTMQQALDQCRMLVEAAEHMAAALAELRDGRRATQHLIEIKRREDAGDRIVRDAIAALFEDEDVSPREIIRWKDVFEALERAIDGCETVGKFIGNIVVKNA